MSNVDDLQRAARLLLLSPIVRADVGDDFRLVKRHVSELREWFDINTGWAIHADSDIVRLAKEPATILDPAHPLRSPSTGQAFSRRRYVMLMLALAALERSDLQVALGRLAEQVVLYGRTPGLAAYGFDFELGTREERSDMVAVIRVLLDWGVLARVSGNEQDFVQSNGDVLYDVSRRVLSQLLVTRRGPSIIADRGSMEERLEAVRDRGIAPSDDLRNLRLRHTLTRRLLDDPVLYFAELNSEETAYLRGQRAAICRRITEATGLVTEYRSEGIAMIDLDDQLTDLRMPENGTDGHVTLIIAEYLAARPGDEVSFDELHAHIREVTPQFSTYWRNGSTDADAEIGLVDQAVSRLVDLKLAERLLDAIRARPALARFAVTAPTITGVSRE